MVFCFLGTGSLTALHSEDFLDIHFHSCEALSTNTVAAGISEREPNLTINLIVETVANKCKRRNKSHPTKFQIGPGLRHRLMNCTCESSFPIQPALSPKSVYCKGPLVKVAGHLKQQFLEFHLLMSPKASQWYVQSPLSSVRVKSWPPRSPLWNRSFNCCWM